MAKCPHCNENHPDELVMCPSTGQAIARAAQTTDPMVGSVLEGKYRVDDKLGEGGMGAVYVGEHVMMKRRIAIKTLLPRFTANQNAVQRFQREAQAASAIGHPNIVTIHDLGQTAEGMLYIVMELLEGQDLAHAIRDLREDPSGPKLMAPARVFALAGQVAEGLAAAHEKGVVHRDLKPDNIFMVPSRDGGERVKLLDFGISKIRTPGGEEARLTTDGSLLGTPYYMSPEQAQGKSDIDHRADIYAFGVILYELLTGRVPFEDANMLRVIAMHALEQPTIPRAINPQIPPEVEALVLKAMAKEPLMRFQTMLEFKDALGAAGGGVDTGATAAGYIQAPPGAGAAPSFAGGGTPPPAGQSGFGTGSGVQQQRPGGLQPTSVIGGPQQGEPSYPGVGASGVGVSGVGASSVGGGPPSGVGQVTATPMAWDQPPPAKSGAGLKIALVIIILLLLGGVGAGVAFLVRSSGGGDGPEIAEPTPQPQPQPQPQPGIPTTQPVPQVPTPQVPFVANPVVPANPATGAVGTVPTPVAPETPPAAVQMVKVLIASDPSGADVYDGETKIGTTPHELLLERGTTAKTYVIKRSGYRHQELEVVPDQDRTIERTLRRARRRPPPGGSSKTGQTQTGSGSTGTGGGLFKANPFGS